MNPDARARRFIRMTDIGCIVCLKVGFHLPGEIHHLNVGGRAGHQRRGDEFTICLCPWHHRAIPVSGFDKFDCEDILGPSLALQPNLFRESFGSDDELLKEQNNLIAAAEKRATEWKSAS